MKNNLFKIISFICILLLPTVIWFGIKFISPDTFDVLDYDLSEKRNKTEINGFEDISTSGDVLADYAADRAPFRSKLITFYQSVQTDIESPYEKVIKPTMVSFIKKREEVARTSAGGAEFNLFDSVNSFIGFGENSEDLENISTSDAKQDRDIEDLSLLQDDATDELENNEEEINLPEEHEYIQVSECEPTCTEPGYRVFACEGCGDYYSEELPVLGHDYQLEKSVEVSYENYGYSDYICNRCGHIKKYIYEPKLIDDSYYAPKTMGPAIVGRYDWLFYTEDIPFYKGTNKMTEAQMQEFLDTLQNLKNLCDSLGKKLAFIIPPNKENVYPEYMPSYTVVDEEKRVPQLVDYIHANSNIAICYPLEQLKYSDMYWQSYLKYDTHWSNIGAFIGVQVLYETIGMPTMDPMSLYIDEQDVDAYGDLLIISGMDATKYPAFRSYDFEYKENVEVTSETDDYTSALLYSCTSTSENTEKLVLIGDSFRTAMVPILRKDFASLSVANGEFLEDIAEDIREADVIVIESVERFDTNMCDYAKRVTEILSDLE